MTIITDEMVQVVAQVIDDLLWSTLHLSEHARVSVVKPCAQAILEAIAPLIAKAEREARAKAMLFLPPVPFGMMITAAVGTHEGNGHVYVTDANGRKIATVWGKPDEKIALANLLIAAAIRARKEER